jgi:hypothetical protein
MTALGFLAVLEAAAAEPPQPPRMLFLGEGIHDPGAAGGKRTGFAIARKDDGTFAFYNPLAPSAEPLRLPDAGGTMHPLLPALPEPIAGSRALLDSGLLNNAQVLLSSDGVVRSVFVQADRLPKEEAAKIGLSTYLDVWFRQGDATGARDAVRTWRGYNGSQMEYQRLKSGRLLVPHGSMIPHAKAVPPTGRHETVIEYSDDGGATWKLSESRLTSPCYEGFNGSNEGACEPCFEELGDGRVWMLMRTQAGCLYESFSSDGGTTWSPAAPTRFRTSTGPANLLRLRDGRIVLTWNHCELPPRHEGEGVYGGRDALHLAISDDEGKTWRGFREIYLDHRRNDNPASNGDRGTAYPLGAFTDEGRIVILAGQGEGGRNPIFVDPDWITATTAETDFRDGLAQWSVYRHTGPAKRWWRARETGCELIETPGEPGTKSLRVRRQDGKEPDTAVWNVPSGWSGQLTARILLPAGSQGAVISLNDRFFDPSNPLGEERAVFRFELKPEDGASGVWQDLSLHWDLGKGSCECRLGDQLVATLPILTNTLNGISYLRLRSAASPPDPHGLVVRRVGVNLTDPVAPPVTAEAVRARQEEYVKTVVAGWR